MTVVTGASPLRYLILIEEKGILPALFGRVLILRTLIGELTKPADHPGCIAPMAGVHAGLARSRDPSTPLLAFPASLGAGERDAIALAEELNADALLIDDQAGRREAQLRRIPIQGTLGVIGLAARHKLIDMSIAVARLRQPISARLTTFCKRFLTGKLEANSSKTAAIEPAQT